MRRGTGWCWLFRYHFTVVVEAIHHPWHGADPLSGCGDITATLCCLCWGTQGTAKCILGLGCLPLTRHLCC